jgi:hypothetical protein
MVAASSALAAVTGSSALAGETTEKKTKPNEINKIKAFLGTKRLVGSGVLRIF